MSKRQIVVQIDCEDERCGECGKAFGPDVCAGYAYECAWTVESDTNTHNWLRGPLCLSAEKKLRDLVEAGEGMAKEIILQEPDWEVKYAWDAALAAIKGGGAAMSQVFDEVSGETMMEECIHGCVVCEVCARQEGFHAALQEMRENILRIETVDRLAAGFQRECLDEIDSMIKREEQ